MASTPQNMASTHTASIFRGTHKFHIVGYGVPKANKPIIRSGDFLAGGHTWALVCGFGDKGDDHLVSITLELVSIGKGEVVALATLRIEDPRGRWPAAVWRSDDPNVFSKTGRSWKLKVPDVFRGHEARYVENDRLTILCAVDVLEGKKATTTESENTNGFLVAVPSSPTISQDLGKLMLMDASGCMPPDVTFVVEQTEIRAHKLVLAMRSSVFAAEFRWHSSTAGPCVIRIEEMSVSTFRAMLRFIYTDELPIKPDKNHVARHPSKEKYAARRCEAMARDLLVAADRYDLERLRLMCEKILSESLDVTTVAMTLQLVCGRHSCRQLEESCIEYIASHPDAYDAVRATEFEDSSSSIIVDINDRVLTHRHTYRSSSPSADSSSHGIQSKESASTHYVSEVVRGAHDFKIPNLNAAQRSHGVGQTVTSGTFKIAGYDWVLNVYPSGYSMVVDDQKHYIAVFLDLMSVPPVRTAGVRASTCFKMEDPNGCALPFVLSSSLKLYASSGKSSAWGFAKFISMEAAKSKYMANDGSLTIRCEVAVTSEPYTSRTSTVGSRVMVSVPPSEISTQLGQLLASENGSDVRFLVEKSEMRAHRLVIAARAPSLHEEVVATKNKEDDHAAAVVRVDDMKAAVFKAMLHFIYTDELLPGDGTRLLAGDMLTAACRFGLRKLKAMCENLLWESLSKRNVLATAKLAHRHHHCKELEDYCIEFASTPDVIKELVNTFIGLED